MRFYLGVTDNKWYDFLSAISPEDVNFWQPGGNKNFRVLQQGAPFLFKLRSPHHAIGGVGIFMNHTFLPINVAWDYFGIKNGCTSLHELTSIIHHYKKKNLNDNPNIGCVVLTNPIFFKQEDWIDVSGYMHTNIVEGKGFETSIEEDNSLWEKVQIVLNKYRYAIVDREVQPPITSGEDWLRYGKYLLQRGRIGQGAFRALITDAYHRKCSISGEKTLPVLEAAHIKPYATEGPHRISNGLLLRSDIHKLFDTGYITITTDYKIEVSKAIREEFENGKEYYQFHGSDLKNLPADIFNRPEQSFIEWHNGIFKG